MTRVLVIIVLILNTFYAGAATVCTRNDKVVIGLSGAATSSEYDIESFSWRVYFDGVGMLSGVSSCSSLYTDVNGCESAGYSGYFGCYLARGGKDTNINFQGRNDGPYCWCKAVHPFETKWYYLHLYNADCPTNCAKMCSARLNAATTDSNSLRYQKDLYRLIDMDE